MRTSALSQGSKKTYAYLLLLLAAVGCGGPAPTEAPPLQLALSPHNPTFSSAVEQRFEVRGTAADGAVQELTRAAQFRVTDAQGRPVAATVRDGGIVGGLLPGHYTLTAIYQGAGQDAAVQTPLSVTVATLVSLALAPMNPTVPRGSNQPFRAIGTFSDGTTQDLSGVARWSIRDVTGFDVASIDSMGVATAKNVGQARVTATYMSKTASTNLQVNPATLTALVVSPSNPSIAKGSSQLFRATGVFSDGTTQDVSSLVTWSVSDVTGSGVASINGTGLAVGKALGKALITAEYLTATAETTLEVTAAALVSLTLSPLDPSIPKGSTQPFSVTGSFTDGTTRNLTTSAAWTATDLSGTGVASVDASGRAVGNAVGRAAITATYMGKSVTTSLQVTAAVLSVIKVTPADPVVVQGGGVKFTASGVYTDGATMDLTTLAVWSATDLTGTGVASIDANGQASAKTPGKSTIKAAYMMLTGSTILTVTAPRLLSLSVSPKTGFVGKGGTLAFKATGQYDDGNTRDLTTLVSWSATDVTGTGVAAIDVLGVALGKALGQATIRAFYNGLSDTATLTVDTGWIVTTSPTTVILRAGWAATANDAWAVGASGTSVHWDGSAWSTVPTTVTTNLTGLWGASSSHVLAVGSGQTTLQWNGSKWTSTNRALFSTLTSIWGANTTDVFATSPIAMWRYTGVFFAPATLDIGMQAVWGTRVGDVWGIGLVGATHYDGTAWTAVTLPGTAVMTSIWGSSFDNYWAVGEAGTILHYDGATWSAAGGGITSRNLTGVWGRSSSDVWAVGEGGVILHYDGSTWSTVRSPTTKNLNAVFGAGGATWIVGEDGTILRYL